MKENINFDPLEVILFMTVNKLTCDLYFFEKFKSYHTHHCGKNQPQKLREIVPPPVRLPFTESLIAITLLPLHHYFLLLAHPLHWAYLLRCYKAQQISLAALQDELHYLNCFHQAGHDERNTRHLNYYNMYLHNIYKIMSIRR